MWQHIERLSLPISSPKEAANEGPHGSLGDTKPLEVTLCETRAISENPLQYDSNTRTVVVDGVRKGLSPTDDRLLRVLMNGQGKVIGKLELRSQLAGTDRPQASDESLRLYVSRLRKKIESDPKRPQRIEGVNRVGYRFNLGPMPNEVDKTDYGELQDLPKKEEAYNLGSGLNYYPERNMIMADGEKNSFTNTENKLFWLLAKKLGEVVQKKELMEEVWGRDKHDIYIDTLLKKYIQRLRRKTGDRRGEDGSFRLIHTVYGIGYKLYYKDRSKISTSTTIYEAPSRVNLPLSS